MVEIYRLLKLQLGVNSARETKRTDAENNLKLQEMRKKLLEKKMNAILTGKRRLSYTRCVFNSTWLRQEQ